MPLSYHHFHKTIGALLVIFLIPATSAFGTVQWEEDDFVKLVARDGAKGIVNNHPLKISPQTISTLLSEIKLIAKEAADANDDKAQALFSESKAKLLGTEISKAFREARPNQDIAFQIMTISSLIGDLITKPTYTAGRIFWRNKRLQIVFGSIRQGIAKRRLLGQEIRIINPPEIGGRNDVVAADYKPALFPGSRYAETRSGGVRSNWLIIDPRETLKQAATSRSKEASDAQTTEQSGDQRKNQAKDSVAARLRYLKSLRERDLISKENYRYKVRQIIDQL